MAHSRHTHPTVAHSRRIALIGFGAIGRALAAPWLKAGHRLTIGSRDPEGLGPQVAPVRCVNWVEAIAESDVVALCLPHAALDDLIASGAGWTGKVVLDATNPVALSPTGRVISGLTTPGPVGVALAGRLPGASVVRVFTHVMDELLASRGQRQPGLWGVAVAGDDAGAKDTAMGLVRDTGFVPVDIGGLADSAPLDPGGVLFPQMFTEADMRARIGAVAPAARDPER